MSQAASPLAPEQPRQLALLALQSVYRGAYADVAVHQTLRRGTLSDKDRGLFTELVYGCVRRRRTLEALIQQFVKKPPPPSLQLLLQLGLYQLRYLNHIPPSAAVHTTVELAKQNGLGGLAGLVNGVLRRYLRASETTDPLQLPSDPIQRIGTLHSFPDWIVQVWVEQFGEAEADALCQWMNRPPSIDLRVNPLTASITEMQAEMVAAGVAVEKLDAASQALRLTSHVGAIDQLPGFAEGKWMVQDASAQLVGQLMAPQPGDLVIDGCAAPGGKATHLAELMGDRGTVWACDRNAKRLRKVEENAQRLQLQSIRTLATDSRQLAQFVGQADRVLLDVPCSGLGTLHRHADARWRQTPASIEDLSVLQSELLAQGATWVKPGGRLVYATCTLHPRENEGIIQPFLKNQPDWCLEKPNAAWAVPFLNPAGWLQVLPHHHQMDGFFMACLRHQG